MAEIRHIFGDVRTGKVIEEIRCQGVSMKDDLDTGGEWRGTFTLDQTGKDNEVLLSATQPGRCFVVTERNGVVIWGGLVWTRTYQSQAKSTQIYAKGFKAYTASRVCTVDLNYVNIEQRNIMRNLYLSMQSDANSVQVTVPSTFNDVVLASLSVKGSDLKTYRSIIDSIADSDNGFDWVITTRRTGASYTHELQIGYPHIGSAAESSAVVFEYPGNITNYWSNESMGSPGTHIFAVGATDSESETTLLARAQHNDLLQGGFPRFDVVTSHKEVESQVLLDGIVRQEAAILKPPMPILTVELKADLDPIMGSYKPGDMAQVVIRDPRYPLTFKQFQRVLSFDYYPPSNDSEELARVVFEGEEYAA